MDQLPPCKTRMENEAGAQRCGGQASDLEVFAAISVSPLSWLNLRVCKHRKTPFQAAFLGSYTFTVLPCLQDKSKDTSNLEQLVPSILTTGAQSRNRMLSSLIIANRPDQWVLIGMLRRLRVLISGKCINPTIFRICRAWE